MNNCYEWLFSEEERKPIGYIVVFALTVLISIIVSLFIVAVDRHVEGWVNYLWN
tara:strand:- start:183 stop:344 length:162 start_codon:yes stop_codon:yes gene_type:complete